MLQILYPTFVRSNLQYSVQTDGPYLARDAITLEHSKRVTTKLVTDLSKFSYDDLLKRPNHSPYRRKQGGIPHLNYLNFNIIHLLASPRTNHFRGFSKNVQESWSNRLRTEFVVTVRYHWIISKNHHRNSTHRLLITRWKIMNVNNCPERKSSRLYASFILLISNLFLSVHFESLFKWIADYHHKASQHRSWCVFRLRSYR